MGRALTLRWRVITASEVALALTAADVIMPEMLGNEVAAEVQRSLVVKALLAVALVALIVTLRALYLT